jgi:hypothetical protein
MLVQALADEPTALQKVLAGLEWNRKQARRTKLQGSMI